MGKDLLFKTLRHDEVDRAPWVPFAGVHAGKLVGYNAEEVLTDGDKLFKSLIEVNKLYRPDGQPVIFDLQIEAEILGCELMWAKDAPPSVVSHPLEMEKEIPTKMIEKSDGRLPMILDVMKRMKKEVGDTTALYGLVCGPFTLASHLRGNMIFMDMFDDPEYVINLVKYSNEVIKKLADYYIEAGMDVIASVDPLVSQISSDHFEEFLSEAYTDFFEHIRNAGVFSSFFVCGDATKNLEVMCETKPDSISIDENISIVTAKAVTDKYNVTLGGNIPLTTVMLHGTQQDNMKVVIDILESVSTKNLIIAPGCDMPYDVPIANSIAVQEAAKDPEMAKKMLENYEATSFEDIEVDLPDYDKLEKPLVEVFTLDSATCAACGYMMVAVNDAWKEFGDKIDVVEYKFTEKENIARCMKMGVKNLPSMYINGELKYSSIIPSKKELIDAIKNA